MTHVVCTGCTQANARRRRESEHKVHKRLRIVAGAAAGKLLLSGRGETTRPMMEKVRRGPRRRARGAGALGGAGTARPARRPRATAAFARLLGRVGASGLRCTAAPARGLLAARAPRQPQRPVCASPARTCRDGRAASGVRRAQVRSAVFDMVAAAGGRAGVLPAGSRWLDLFAGTGSVGLEALSRGAAHCRFIELDHWVVSNVRAAALTLPQPTIASAWPGERQPVRGRARRLAALPSKQAVWCLPSRGQRLPAAASAQSFGCARGRCWARTSRPAARTGPRPCTPGARRTSCAARAPRPASLTPPSTTSGARLDARGWRRHAGAPCRCTQCAAVADTRCLRRDGCQD